MCVKTSADPSFFKAGSVSGRDVWLTDGDRCAEDDAGSERRGGETDLTGGGGISSLLSSSPPSL